MTNYQELEERILLKITEIVNRPGLNRKERIFQLRMIGCSWEFIDELLGKEEKASDY